MREDEPYRLINVEQACLVLHDEFISVVVGLGLTRRVLERHLSILAFTGLHLSEIPRACVHWVGWEEFVSGRGLCSFLRIEGIKSRSKGTVGIQIIDAFAKVGGNFVNEEQREDLDAVFVNLILLADVFSDGFADHLAEDGVLVVSECFPQT